MTDYDLEPEEPRGWSPLAVSMIATLVLLLGLAGSLFGIYVANVNAQAAAAATPSPTREILPTTPTTTPPVTTPATTPPTSTPPVTTSTPAASFPLPKLAGLDFKVARGTVRDLKLGWTLKFEGLSNDATVRDSSPTTGALVVKGDNVTIFVKGAAPLAVVPVIVGKQCATAADLIIDAGLYPDYKTAARTGTVLPAAVQAGLHWNDKMQLTCSG